MFLNSAFFSWRSIHRKRNLLWPTALCSLIIRTSILHHRHQLWGFTHYFFHFTSARGGASGGIGPLLWRAEGVRSGGVHFMTHIRHGQPRCIAAGLFGMIKVCIAHFDRSCSVSHTAWLWSWWKDDSCSHWSASALFTGSKMWWVVQKAHLHQWIFRPRFYFHILLLPLSDWTEQTAADLYSTRKRTEVFVGLLFWIIPVRSDGSDGMYLSTLCDIIRAEAATGRLFIFFLQLFW